LPKELVAVVTKVTQGIGGSGDQGFAQGIGDKGCYSKKWWLLNSGDQGLLKEMVTKVVTQRNGGCSKNWVEIKGWGGLNP
jgi:hypothetical protein